MSLSHGMVMSIVAVLASGCSKTSTKTEDCRPDLNPRPDIVAAKSEEVPRLKVVEPLDGAVFPSDMAPVLFRWEDDDPRSDGWLIEVAFADGRRFSDRSGARQWTPSDEQWETIQQYSREGRATVTISGVDSPRAGRVVSRGSIAVSTSRDAVAAPMFYREVNLPFREAVKDPSRIRWRFGTVASRHPPRVVLDGLPVCGNCHSFSADGAVLGMDVDYANDKGSYAISPVSRQTVLDREKIISWKDYRGSDDEPTFGLLSQVSPNGRYVISTVRDLSVFVPRDDLAFSQLFFPVKGILAVYDRVTRSFRALPGADDKRFVQSNPTWSPDGKWIVFARSTVYELKRTRPSRSALLTPEQCREFLDGRVPFRFDLYRIAFHDGDGGTPEPLAGASGNGMSNYFARYSPDGKWIVFCRAKNFMLLQPDSELWIVPAAGGQARRLQCNTARMNSWHSWSPNGKWLVFSSKLYSACTQLFLTHIDAEGNSTVPVVLSRFTAPDRAANIPEFVNLAPDAIDKITADFLDDRNYYRAAIEYVVNNEPEGAIPLLRKSLEVNPHNTETHVELAGALARIGKTEEAKTHLARVIELLRSGSKSDDLAEAHARLGFLLYNEHQLQQAAEHCQQALSLQPGHSQARALLGVIQLDAGQAEDGAANITHALRQGPQDAFTNYAWGYFLFRHDKPAEAVGYYQRALQEDPQLVSALLGLASLRLMHKHPQLFNRQEALALAEKACKLTRRTDLSSLRMLAGAYAVSGRFDDAVSAAREALAVAHRSGDQQSAAGIQEMLILYERLQAKQRR